MILIGILISIIIILSISLIICIVRSKAKLSTVNGRLFIYTESFGLGIPDYQGLPKKDIVNQNFEKVALVIPWVGKVLSPSVLPDQSPTLKKVQDQYGSDRVELWVALYMANDGWFSLCAGCQKNCGSCPNDPKPTKCADQFKSCLTQYLFPKNKNKYNITGLLFDNEFYSGEKTADVAQSIERYVADLGLNIKLAWSGAMCEANSSSPPNPSECGNHGRGTKEWDFCLGQLYTNSTTSYYQGSCNCDATNFWKEFAGYEFVDVNRAVPMVCGAGNCQENQGSVGSSCVDERLLPGQIEELIQAKPSDVPNFAIWYGTLDGHTKWNTGTQIPVGKTKGCVTKKAVPDGACWTKCCDSWQFLGS